MNKQNKPKFNIHIWLLYLMICSFLVSGVTFSKYITSSGNDAGGRVGKFSFNVVENETQHKIVDLTEIEIPGDSKTIQLEISNKEAGGISEVAEKYTVSLKNIGSLPLKYTITSDVDGFVNIVHNVSANVDECTFSGEFPPAVETKHTYTLMVEWPETEKSYKYSSGSGISSLTATITGEQID